MTNPPNPPNARFPVAEVVPAPAPVPTRRPTSSRPPSSSRAWSWKRAASCSTTRRRPSRCLRRRWCSGRATTPPRASTSSSAGRSGCTCRRSRRPKPTRSRVGPHADRGQRRRATKKRTRAKGNQIRPSRPPPTTRVDRRMEMFVKTLMTLTKTQTRHERALQRPSALRF